MRSQSAAQTTPEDRWNGAQPLRLLVGPYVHEEHCGYMEGAFDDYEVVTFGPWEGSDLCIEGIQPLEDILSMLPDDFTPDLMLLWRPEYTAMPIGLEKAPFPVAMLISDWYVAFTECMEVARFVNTVITGTRGERVFRAAGFDHVRAMPMLGYQQGVDGAHRAKRRDIDVLCAGNPNWTVHREREQVVAELMELPPKVRYVHSPFVDRQTYNELLGRSKIFVNETVIGEINMKCYEVPAAGACLFVEESNLDIRDYLVPDESVVLYKRENLREKILYYLKHEKRRAAIAAAGHEAMRGRSYRAQMKEIVEALRGTGRDALLRQGREILHADEAARAAHFAGYAVRHTAKNIDSGLRFLDTLPDARVCRKPFLQGIMHYTARGAVQLDGETLSELAWKSSEILPHLRREWDSREDDLALNVAWAQLAADHTSPSETQAALDRAIAQLSGGCRIPLGGSNLYTLPRNRRYVFERTAWEQVEIGVPPDGALRAILLDFLLVLKADSLRRLGDTDQAIQTLYQAVAAYPAGDFTRPALARWLLAKERLGEASDVLQDHLVQRPLDQEARTDRVRALVAMERFEEAREEVGRALRVARVFCDTELVTKFQELQAKLPGLQGRTARVR